MIAAALIDTNAYSGFRRGRPECIEVFSSVPKLVVPLAVIAELLAGFLAGRKADANRSELARFLSSQRVHLHRPDQRTAEIYAQVYQQLRRDGHPIPTNDLWVAASALQLDIPLITFDAQFSHVTGLRSADSLVALLRAAAPR